MNQSLELTIPLWQGVLLLIVITGIVGYMVGKFMKK